MCSARKIYFLLPGTSGKYLCGGLKVGLQASRVLEENYSTQVVTYKQREKNFPFLNEALKKEISKESSLWIISWGYDIPKLINKLKGRAIAYHAHSCGYGFSLPKNIPILAVSKNTLGYWGEKAPENPIFLIENALEQFWIDQGARKKNIFENAENTPGRETDVLVQKRKSSKYILKQLVPKLKKLGLNVKVQSTWVDDIAKLFNESKVYLYDSSEYWKRHRLTEGFGLPPMEAIACGCVVFSSFNHGLSDYLEPGIIGHQIYSGNPNKDLENIVSAVNNPNEWVTSTENADRLIAKYNEKELSKRWDIALKAINRYWDLEFKK